MVGFWRKQGQYVTAYPTWSLAGLLLMSFLVAMFHWPLALPIFLISGLLSWHLPARQHPLIILAVMAPVFQSMFGQVDFYIINYMVILSIQFIMVSVFKGCRSWPITIELTTLGLMVFLCFVMHAFPAFQHMIERMLMAQQALLVRPESAVQAQQAMMQTKPYLLGIFAMITFAEGMLYTACSAWWHNQTTSKKRQSWMELRLSKTLLSVAALVVLGYLIWPTATILQVGLVLFVPFFCAGTATAYWLYQHSIFKKKVKYSGVIWLIFILLYGTLLPLALAILGLLDVGVDFRKRVLLKQKQ